MDSNTTPQTTESNVSLEGMLGQSTVQVQQPAVETPAPVAQPPVVETPQNTSSLTTNGNLPETVTEVPTVIKELQSTQLDAEQQQFKTELLTLFKGDKLNEKGDVLNAEGKIVATAKELDSYINNQDLVLDAEGNAINALGEVIVTKEKLIEQTPSAIVTIKSSIENNFGITLPADLEVEDSVAGISKLVETAVAVQSQNTIKNFLDHDPELKAFYHHLKLGGSADTYQSSNIDYKSIDVKKLDEASKVDLLNKMLKLQGNPNSETMVDLIKKGGEDVLNQSTVGAIKYLNDKQSERNKTNEDLLQQKYQQQVEADNKYWNDVKTIVDGGKLKEIEIPIKDREAFFGYMATPVDKNGNSADSLASENDSVELQLLVSYLRFKGGNLSDLVKNIAKTEKVNSLTELMNKHKGRNESGVPRASSAKPTGGSISLETLLG